MEEFRIISLFELEIDPLQPRRHITHATIVELADTMKPPIGIIEPLIVRKKLEGLGFRIVCGERRFRAASVAGLIEVPCMIRELTDDQVFDIQVIENLQRENVSPLDEADAYNTLISKKRCTLHEIAERFGKTEEYVFGRLRLINLIPEAKTYLEEEILPVTAAIKIATLTERQQADTIKRVIIESTVNGQPKKWFTGLNDLKIYFENNVSMPLSIVDFDTTDKNLCPQAGDCKTCTKRTGNTLFKDILDGDKCLDSACYKEKHVEHYQQLQKKLSKKHKTEVVFAARFYGAEREFKALGEILPMTAYRTVEGKETPNAVYALFVGPDRTRINDDGMPLHGWIEVTNKVAAAVTTTAVKKSVDKEKEKEILNTYFFVLDLFEQYKGLGIKSPSTYTFKLIITKLMAEYSLSSEVICDIVKRYKVSMKAQQFDGKDWTDVVIDKNFKHDPKGFLSLDYDDIMIAFVDISHVNAQKLVEELVFIGSINDEATLNGYASNYDLDIKAAKKQAEKSSKAKLKELSK